ncbi:MAG: hypothetical protein MUF15_03445 [Acidobacteria bacterium]|jgi:hypothetical protein|nr:hypothetical protein [Acidobacteriota bacterium]
MKNEHITRRRRRVGFWILILVAVILAASTIRIEIEKISHKKEFKRLEKEYLSLYQNADTGEEIKRRRAEYFKNRFLSNFPSRYAYGAADFMRRLSLIDSKNIVLEKLEITPRGQDFAFNLIIAIDADTSQAQGIFSRYYRELQNFDDLVEINFSHIDARTGKRKNFKIAGTIEIE